MRVQVLLSEHGCSTLIEIVVVNKGLEDFSSSTIVTNLISLQVFWHLSTLACELVWANLKLGLDWYCIIVQEFKKKSTRSSSRCSARRNLSNWIECAFRWASNQDCPNCVPDILRWSIFSLQRALCLVLLSAFMIAETFEELIGRYFLSSNSND